MISMQAGSCCPRLSPTNFLDVMYEGSLIRQLDKVTSKGRDGRRLYRPKYNLKKQANTSHVDLSLNLVNWGSKSREMVSQRGNDDDYIVTVHTKQKGQASYNRNYSG